MSRKLLYFALRLALVIWLVAAAASLWFSAVEAAPTAPVEKVWVCHYNEAKPWKSKPFQVKASDWEKWPDGKSHAGHPLDFLLTSQDDPACVFDQPTETPTPDPTTPAPTDTPTPPPPTETPTPEPTDTPTPEPTDTPTPEPTDTPTPTPDPTETPVPCGGECEETPTPTPTVTPETPERRPEPATGLLWLLTNGRQHCLLFAESHPSIERQGALCWPDWFNGSWVASNTPCAAPVLDDDTWECDKFTPWRLPLGILKGIYENHISHLG